MSYRQRLSLFLIIDSCIVITAIFISCFLVNGTIDVITFPIVLISVVILISHYLLSFKFHLYKKAWEYASVGELLSILKIVTISVFLAAICQQLIVKELFYRLLAVTWLL